MEFSYQISPILCFFKWFKKSLQIQEKINNIINSSNPLLKSNANNIYLEIDHKWQSKCLNEIYKTVFSMNEKYNTKFINFSSENMISTAHKLVHYGWKKEAIPISVAKKSFIAGLFDRIFGWILFFLETLVVLRLHKNLIIRVQCKIFIKKQLQNR